MQRSVRKGWRSIAVALVCMCLPVRTGSAELGNISATMRGWLTGEATLPGGLGQLQSRARWQDVYSTRAYKPFWLEGNKPNKQALQLIRYLGNVQWEGLEPPRSAPPLGNGKLKPVDAAALELHLTDTLLSLAAALYMGEAGPVVDPGWFFSPSVLNPGELMAAIGRGRSVQGTLDGLRPPQAAYARLRRALNHYRAVALFGGWPALAPGASLRPGDRDQRIVALRRRLVLTDDLTAESERTPDPWLYDSALETAVRRFQGRHGLAVDGIVGEKTRAAMNVRVEERIVQLRAGMERWRWLPRKANSRYIAINIPDYRLTLYEGEQPRLRMKVIVGRADEKWQTPSFSTVIRSLVTNPDWVVPRSIVEEEIWPRFVANPEYLRRAGLQMLGSGGAPVTLSREAVRHMVREGRMPGYQVMQYAGPGNPLGRLKFNSPNRFDIYLHDTPDRHLFARGSRALSHGCVRLERPLQLVKALFGERPAQLMEALGSGQQLTLLVPEPVPVYFLYMTAWVDEDGQVQFRDDVYRRNGKLISFLKHAGVSLAANAN